MAQPYVGQILLFAGTFAPAGYLPCDGRTIDISGNEVLFTLIGTTFGGDGQNNFALPDLRGRASVGMGAGTGLPTYALGQNGGSEQVTLSTNQIALHNHPISTAGAASTTGVPTGSTILADEIGGGEGGTQAKAYAPYNANTQATLAGGTIGLAPTSGPLPHENRQPLLAVTIAIATQGDFPPQS
jgi:microcystin-dependent protein